MTKKLHLLAALAGVALIGNAFAYSPQDKAKTAGTEVPRPILSSVIRPNGLPQQFTGAVINVEFSIDQDGQPRDIKVLHVSDHRVTRVLMAAFRQWRFEYSAGGPATYSKRFILPIELRPEA